MKELKFYVMADPHFFASELGCSGDEYEDFMHYEQKCFAETESINNSVFEFLKNEDLKARVVPHFANRPAKSIIKHVRFEKFSYGPNDVFSLSPADILRFLNPKTSERISPL